MDLNGVRSAAGQVTAAIEGAAQATGVDFGFLMRTARRESSLNPLAQARTSSAAGLFQFVDQTWLGTLRRHGARHGYGRYAEMITGSAGRWRAVSAEARQAVMGLRLDPVAASLMAAELASDAAAYLRGRIGRQPTGGELYVAHFLGPAGSARLIQAHDQDPSASAAALFPQAAAANRSIFYRGGRAATVGEVYANLTRGHGGEAATAERAASPATPTAPSVEAPARTPTLQAALQRIRAQQAMVSVILGQGGGAALDGLGGAAEEGRSMLSGYSSQIAAMLSPDRTDRDRR